MAANKKIRGVPPAPFNKREMQRTSRAKKRGTRAVWQTGLIVLVVVTVAVTLFWAILSPRPGEYVPSQGNSHIEQSQMGQFPYSTTPPTSGPHLPTLAPWGVHDQVIPNEPSPQPGGWRCDRALLGQMTSV